jgi:hypothetical protein
MGSSRPRTVETTATQTNTPDPLTQAMRQSLFDQSTDIYGQGMPAFYPGSTVAQFSPQTQSAMNYMSNYAQQGPRGLGQAYGAAQRGMSGVMPGFGVASGAARGQMDNRFTGSLVGAANQSNPWMNEIANAPSRMDTLQATARGDMIGANPYLDRIFQRGSNQIQNQVDGAMRRAGMTGGTPHSQVMADSLQDLYSNIYAPAYQQERQNQLSAAGTLGQMQMGALGSAGDIFAQDRGASMAGYSSGAGLFADDMNRRMSGAGMMNDMYGQSNNQALQWQQALPGLYNYGLMPAGTMGAVGGMYEDMDQRNISADRERYEYDAGAARNNVSWLANMYNGLPTSPYGTQSRTDQQLMPRSNPFMNALGGASAGSAFGPWGALIGAGIGAVSGSDIRIKQDIEWRGADERGVKWYEFAYKADPGARHVGVMAQELAQIAPQFVHDIDGVLHVDYNGLAAWQG